MKDFSFPLDSILVWKNGKIIKSSAELKENDIVNLRFFEGDKNAKIIG